MRATKSGKYLLIEIKKINLSSWRLLSIIELATGAKSNEIGYAGLKDKSATAIQYLTLPIEYEKSLKNIISPRVEILSLSYTNRAIKIGSLSGNKFAIKLKMDKRYKSRFANRLKDIQKWGMPNYFGYQRFGNDGKSWEQGAKTAQSGKRLKGAKERLLVASYQSFLFNEWLKNRVAISKYINLSKSDKIKELSDYPLALIKALKNQPHIFKLFIGDIMQIDNRLINCKDMNKESFKFLSNQSIPTGLLPGSRVQRALSDARFLEEPFDDIDLTSLKGERRAAWVYPKDCSIKDTKDGIEVSFALPPGSYATTLLEETGGFELKNNKH